VTQTRYEASIAGCRAHPCSSGDLLCEIESAIHERRKRCIIGLNLHGLYVYHKNTAFRALQRDDRTLVHIDGMSIVWLARLFGGHASAAHRTGCIDWFPDLLDRSAERGWRVYYLGGSRRVQEDGLAYMRRRQPGLAVDGRDGYFDVHDGTEAAAVVARINAFKPDVLLVGMGMGRQEEWILANIDRLDVPCITTMGACLEYFAGAVPMPPRVLGPLGLEWLFRLVSNPRRFWRRYLVEPWAVALFLARDELRMLRMKRTDRVSS